MPKLMTTREIKADVKYVNAQLKYIKTHIAQLKHTATREEQYNAICAMANDITPKEEYRRLMGFSTLDFYFDDFKLAGNAVPANKREVYLMLTINKSCRTILRKLSEAGACGLTTKMVKYAVVQANTLVANLSIIKDH